MRDGDYCTNELKEFSKKYPALGLKDVISYYPDTLMISFYKEKGYLSVIKVHNMEYLPWKYYDKTFKPFRVYNRKYFNSFND